MADAGGSLAQCPAKWSGVPAGAAWAAPGWHPRSCWPLATSRHLPSWRRLWWRGDRAEMWACFLEPEGCQQASPASPLWRSPARRCASSWSAAGGARQGGPAGLAGCLPGHGHHKFGLHERMPVACLLHARRLPVQAGCPWLAPAWPARTRPPSAGPAPADPDALRWRGTCAPQRCGGFITRSPAALHVRVSSWRSGGARVRAGPGVEERRGAAPQDQEAARARYALVFEEGALPDSVPRPGPAAGGAC